MVAEVVDLDAQQQLVDLVVVMVHQLVGLVEQVILLQ